MTDFGEAVFYLQSIRASSFRNQGAPVLDIYNPAGVDRSTRRTMLDYLGELNELKFQDSGDREIRARIAQYELAGRMQASVPELLDFRKESQRVLDSYGPDVKQQGTYAYNCLLARRLAERGVRFIQLFHQGWDQHGSLPKQITLAGPRHRSANGGIIAGLEIQRHAR